MHSVQDDPANNDEHVNSVKDARRLKYGQKSIAKIDDGKIIDRTRVCFLLQESPVNKNMLTASDRTIYQRQADGSLRRLHRMTNKSKYTPD